MSGLQRAIRHPDRLNDPHARARELASEALLGPLAETDADWLGDHLAGCGPCRAAADAFAADAAVLRGLRDEVPPVPRDLGARVSLALDDEVRRAMRPSLARRAMGWGSGGRTSIRRPSLAFVGLAALAMVALLVGPLALPAGTLPAATSPAGSLLPTATPITVDTDVAWVRRSSDGTYVISSAQVGQVCPGVDASACGTLDGSARTLAALHDKPTSVVLQRDRTQAVVVGQDTVYAVAVNSPPPVTTPGPDTSPVPTKAPVQTPAATGSRPLLRPTLPRRRGRPLRRCPPSRRARRPRTPPATAARPLPRPR